MPNDLNDENSSDQDSSSSSDVNMQATKLCRKRRSEMGKSRVLQTRSEMGMFNSRVHFADTYKQPENAGCDAESSITARVVATMIRCDFEKKIGKISGDVKVNVDGYAGDVESGNEDPKVVEALNPQALPAAHIVAPEDEVLAGGSSLLSIPEEDELHEVEGDEELPSPTLKL